MHALFFVVILGAFIIIRLRRQRALAAHAFGLGLRFQFNVLTFIVEPDIDRAPELGRYTTHKLHLYRANQIRHNSSTTIGQPIIIAAVMRQSTQRCFLGMPERRTQTSGISLPSYCSKKDSRGHDIV